VSIGPQLSAQRPFPGLRPFGFDDREFFFGREDQVYSLYRLLDLCRFIAVIGSSGSGKSSLVRAGLLPLIQDETEEAGGRNWRSVTFHPGDAPLAELADALTELASAGAGDEGDREIRHDRISHALKRSSFGLSEALDEIPGLEGTSLLIVVDQFEELFRFAGPSAASGSEHVNDALWRDEAAQFVQLILEISRDRARSVHVMITMRSDFIGDCARFHGLPEAVSAAQFLVPSLTRDQREDVIRKPVEKAGATVEPALVERLLNDVSDELDQLPVLQHCLLRIWDRAAADVRP
jgi:energy-coupling factor transporter ATP-binding protein EcfA2